MKLQHFAAISAISAFALGACATTATGDMAAVADTDAKSADYQQNEQQAQPEQRRSRGGGHSKADFFNAYDENEDGVVTTDEYIAVRDKGYDDRDPNGDAKVMPDEYVAEYEARLEEDLAAMRDRQLKQAYVRFGVLDTDKDGIMTREEFQAAGTRMFERLDTNKDGIVNDADTKDAY